ncbi:MAG TPA: 23S rRNA (uracil(1939)-C(5))-methyltransferase RlmD [Candidatus Udaeobacter sp.]|jgi:23S rRNA (uracil1939-C5)-methyltransferase|nr:23S rRNA (uracil(1939)-C(5))-methyltransferase RlmD [Candidatus Udaeobacter sp.]
MKVNDLLNIEIESLALGGQAVGRLDGRVVFVDRALPGDHARARITRARRNYLEARLEGVDQPSPWRVPAPCPHVSICGGCRFQDLDYGEQLRQKQRQVRETLERLGGIQDPPVRDIVPAPEPFGYRNKMEFSFAPDAEGRPVLGLHARGTYDRVFALETCLLPSRLTVEIVRFTQRFASDRGWRAYHPVRHQGVARFLTVRHLPLSGECAVHLIAAGDDLSGLAEWARAVAALSPEVRGVTLGISRSRANVAVSEEERVLEGRGTIVERLLGLEFEASANAFLQTNSRQAEALYSAALECASLAQGERVLDLYCGTGTLTLLFARAGARAIGVESVADAVAAAERNARRNRVGDASFVCGEARAVLRQWARGERPSPGRPHLVVVDPPRAGLHPRVVQRVAELEPARIVYVSCNPATLARDLKDFGAAGYHAVDVRPFDMFPHTPHIECVVRLEPARDGTPLC